VVGAVVLIGFGLLPWRNAVAAAAKGTNVYLFLIGMMLLPRSRVRKAVSIGWRRSPFGTREFSEATVPDHLCRRYDCHGVPIE